MNLKDYLARAGITQAEFAEYIDVNPRTVRRWVSGEATTPKIVLLFIKLDPIRLVRKLRDNNPQEKKT